MTPTSGPRLLTRRRMIGGGLAAGSGALLNPSLAQSVSVRVLRAGPRTVGEDPAGQTLAFDGAVPGPVLRTRRGEEVSIRLVNTLPEPTAIHWHGVRLGNAMDGVPGLTQPPVAPGASFDYRFVPPDAGTFWYRAYDGPGRGLYGLLVVEETAAGEFDRDVAISIDAAARLTIEGASAPDIAIGANERLRLRLLNAAPNRMFALRFDRHLPWVMAIDGQPAEPFVAREGRITLGPGNRIDLFLDGAPAAGATASILVDTKAESTTLARLVYGPEPARPSPRPAPKPLPANLLPQRMDFRGAQRLDIPIPGNPAKELPPRPAFAVKRGRTVMLNCTNRTSETQVLHLHGHSFRLLDRLDDGWKPFWLDTVPVAAADNVRIAFVADNPGKWLIEAHGQSPSLRAWFEVA